MQTKKEITMQTLPAILERAISRDFANRQPSINCTGGKTWQVAYGNVCMYYILNADESDIIDIQVD